jgi:hypothetical protein
MMKYLINPTDRGCIGVVDADDDDEAKEIATRRFGLSKVWLKQIR